MPLPRRRGGRYRNVHEEPLPPCASDKWREWSAPLLGFLSVPRTWAEINAWKQTSGHDASMLRNCLAWLETMKLVQDMTEEGEVRWVGREALADHLLARMGATLAASPPAP